MSGESNCGNWITGMRNSKFYLMLLIALFYSCPSNRDNIQGNLYKHVSYLASDELRGRYSTTRGDTLAREYIINYYKKLGLSEYHGSYLQGFDFLSNILADGEINIETPETTLTLNRGSDFFVRLSSGSAKITHCGVVFIGAGIHLKRNAKRLPDSISGKIVITYLYPYKGFYKKYPGNSTLSLQELINLLIHREVKGIIFIRPSEKIGKFSRIEDRYPYHQNLTQYPIPIVELKRQCLRRILKLININPDSLEEKAKPAEKLHVATLPDLRLSINLSVQYVYKKAYNVIGVLEGHDTTKVIIAGAHYDHLPPKRIEGTTDSIRNGADDNASGVALLLELAGVMKRQKKPDYSIIFVCFGAEESGRLGSAHFLEKYRNELPGIKAMVNFDMVGRMRDNKLYISFTWSNEKWKELLNGLKDCGINMVIDSLNPLSDSDVFLKKGIPTICITTGPHEDLHRVTDSIGKINFEGMVRIHKLAVLILQRIPEIFEEHPVTKKPGYPTFF